MDNQASEKLNKLLERYRAATVGLPSDVSVKDIEREILAFIRTEKLKLLDRLSSHQEDLFWWTGGEYEKTKAVDMRAIAAEREKLTKLEAEL